MLVEGGDVQTTIRGTPLPQWQNRTDTQRASQIKKKKKKRHSLFVGIGQSEFFCCLKTSLLSS